MSPDQGSWIDRHVPRQVARPYRLALDLLQEPNPAARSALLMAVCGLLLTPLDLALAPFERRLYAKAPRPSRPIVLVAGPPRSGTTLVAQALINVLDVAYPNNLGALFPRSPITIIRLLQHWVQPRPGRFDAFYGRSAGLAGTNDGLELWDRWLGADRARVPAALLPGSATAIPQFFGAFQAHFGKPVVNKVNRLNTCAHLVAAALPEAYFIFLQRDPVMLAQSLYVARERIVGDLRRAYGTQHPDAAPDDPVEDVCRQVLFHETQLERQRSLLPRERYMVLSYESFCGDPGALVERVRRTLPEVGPRMPAQQPLPPFKVSAGTKLPADTAVRMRARLAAAGAGRVDCDPLQG